MEDKTVTNSFNVNKWIDDLYRTMNILNHPSLKYIIITKIKMRPDVYNYLNNSEQIIHDNIKGYDSIFSVKVEIDENLKEPFKIIHRED